MANNLGLPTLAATMDELTRRGFTEHCIPANGMLRAVALRTRRWSRAENTPSPPRRAEQQHHSGRARRVGVSGEV